jgi:hypothetical protein
VSFAAGSTPWSLPRARRLQAQVDQHCELSGKKLDGKAADWMEQVTDEQYQA